MLINNNFQKGSLVLAAVLVSAVAATVALSLAGLSLRNMKLSVRKDESSAALKAAESGAEWAIYNISQGFAPTPLPESRINNASVTVNYSDLNPSGGIFVIPGKLENGESASVKLKDSANKNLTICWKNTAAIGIEIIYDQSGNYLIGRAAFDPSIIRAGVNHFTLAETETFGVSPCGSGYNAWGSLDVSTLIDALVVPVSARVRIYYASSEIALKGEPLDVQGYEISSAAQTDSGVTRKVKVIQTFPAPPAQFDFAVYSGQDLSK